MIIFYFYKSYTISELEISLLSNVRINLKKAIYNMFLNLHFILLKKMESELIPSST